MDQDEQDDLFPDEIDLDDLPANALDELEERAVLLSTQAKAPLAFNQYRNSQPASSDYGLEDEDVVDLDAPHTIGGSRFTKPSARAVDEVTLREQWRQERYSRAVNVPQPQETWIYDVEERPSQLATAAGRPTHPEHHHKVDPDSFQPQFNLDALQSRILELEQERNALLKSAEDAKATARSKAGEIAIVRGNHEKTTKEYERRMAAIQQTHSEELAKQRAELEAARKDRETVETNNRFLEHDLAQEAERARIRKRVLKDSHVHTGRKLSAQSSPVTTPKKDRSIPFRDGFDDEEVVFISPSKPKVTSRPATPKAGLKRKRAQSEQHPSPGQALPLTAPEMAPEAEGPVVDYDHAQGTASQPIYDSADEKLELMQMILNHRPLPGRERTLETLTRHCFPSATPTSVSSLLHDHFAFSPPKLGIDDFRRGICDLLISFWSRCLEEQFHVPLYNLTELLRYIFMLSPPTLSTSFIPRVVPLCLATADLVALPTAKASMTPLIHERPSDLLQEQIDPTDYLNLLHLLAFNCYPNKDDLATFWTAMEFDFVLLMLHKAQPLSQITQMLELLGTSLLPTSFGALSPSSQQPKNETNLVDRLTILLFETPSPALDEPSYTALELSHLRTRVLHLLRTLAYTCHGGTLLATHRLAIGRLVRFLHDAIISMYRYIPSTHTITTALINNTVLLLGQLTSEHAADIVDIRVKLAAVPAGAHKHLVSLSRVAFAEGESVIEGGLDGEVAECAHRMLDELLSPEEGEAVVGVFSSARG